MLNILGVPLIQHRRKRRGRPKGSSGTARSGAVQNASQILLMRAEGRTLAEIGETFGVTTERVRQILKANGIAGWLPRTEKPPRIKNFKAVIIRWLRWAGYNYCPSCKSAKCPEEFTGGRGPHCKLCEAVRRRDQYRNNPRVREYVEQYSRSPKARECQKRYYSRPEIKERRNANSRDRHARLMATDPEYRERMRIQSWKAAERIRQDPERTAKRRAQQKAHYQRRKAAAQRADAVGGDR